jgi:hypothetical protein
MGDSLYLDRAYIYLLEKYGNQRMCKYHHRSGQLYVNYTKRSVESFKKMRQNISYIWYVFKLHILVEIFICSTSNTGRLPVRIKVCHVDTLSKKIGIGAVTIPINGFHYIFCIL